MLSVAPEGESIFSHEDDRIFLMYSSSISMVDKDDSWDYGSMRNGVSRLV